MSPPQPLDADAAYRAADARDSRWDGRVFMAVLTTGIYCRPSCPARTPLRQNCRFYPSAAAAVAAGFRACKRCRPDALPGSRDWDIGQDLAARAVRMIRDGAVDDGGVAGVAAALHVSPRHLHRVLVADVGASPAQLAQTRRAQTARLLIEETDLTLTDVAFAAGFGSIRQFNDAMRVEFGVVPSALRRPKSSPQSAHPREPRSQRTAAPGEIPLRLRIRAPYAAHAMLSFLVGHAAPGLELIEPEGWFTRSVPAEHGSAVVRVRFDDQALADPGREHVDLRLTVANLADLSPVVARVRRWLDLDCDPRAIDEHLSGDPRLAPLVATRPGLRVPGSVDCFELSIRAVLGQQVTVAAGCTLAGRLVAAFGSSLSHTAGPAATALRAFPAAEQLAGLKVVDVASIGMPTSRARTVLAVAKAVTGGLELGSGADRPETRQALLALPGVGPWTADYIALRGLGDPDAFPDTDLILRRWLIANGSPGTKPHVATAAWSPWRAYAAVHLWANHSALERLTQHTQQRADSREDSP